MKATHWMIGKQQKMELTKTNRDENVHQIEFTCFSIRWRRRLAAWVKQEATKTKKTTIFTRDTKAGQQQIDFIAEQTVVFVCLSLVFFLLFLVFYVSVECTHRLCVFCVVWTFDHQRPSGTIWLRSAVPTNAADACILSLFSATYANVRIKRHRHIIKTCRVLEDVATNVQCGVLRTPGACFISADALCWLRIAQALICESPLSTCKCSVELV